MKRTAKLWLLTLVAFQLPLLSVRSHAQSSAEETTQNQSADPDNAGYVSAAGAATQDPLPIEFEMAAQRHAEQERLAPAWVNQLKQKTIASYFGDNVNGKLSASSRERLFTDAMRLHFYFEDEGKNVADGYGPALRKYIMSLTAKKLAAPEKEIDIAGPVAEWSVETLVIKKQTDLMAARPHFLQKTMQLITGPHLRAVSRYGAMLGLTAASVYMLSHYEIAKHGTLGHIGSYLAVGTAGLLIGGFKAGPVATILNASTGWFLTPTTELIKVLNSRYTGPIEERINNFYDRFKTKPKAESNRNERPKIANLEEDGMNFANMSAEDQQKNWDKSMRMWVAVAKRFGQLLRDTHHSGRYLMMMSWTDEQSSATLIEIMASKLVNIDVRIETMLTPHKTAFLVLGKPEMKIELEHAVREFQVLSKKLWSDLTATEVELEKTVNGLETTKASLERLGLSSADLTVLEESEAIRAKAVGTLVTAIALNEMRSFGVAEANRNLAPEARKAQRAMRFGMNLQKYVMDYLPLVQHQMTQMGFEHSGDPAKVVEPAAPNCEELLTPAS